MTPPHFYSGGRGLPCFPQIRPEWGRNGGGQPPAGGGSASARWWWAPTTTSAPTEGAWGAQITPQNAMGGIGLYVLASASPFASVEWDRIGRYVPSWTYAGFWATTYRGDLTGANANQVRNLQDTGVCNLTVSNPGGGAVFLAGWGAWIKPCSPPQARGASWVNRQPGLWRGVYSWNPLANDAALVALPAVAPGLNAYWASAYPSVFNAAVQAACASAYVAVIFAGGTFEALGNTGTEGYARIWGVA